MFLDTLPFAFLVAGTVEIVKTANLVVLHASTTFPALSVARVRNRQKRRT